MTSDESDESDSDNDDNVSIDFTSKWDGADVCFLVENTKVYAHKWTLACWSPVFKAMFR